MGSCQREGLGEGKIDEGDSELQTFSYKINKSWGFIYIA